ncbi:MAG: hypothetical protein ABIR17_05945 [Pseudolysinimonas sp.]|uniref:hypothetical protein n=1 Tax=Pseudolysinimonas sp. TaxID=2680009 RepID=UPI0032653E4E
MAEFDGLDSLVRDALGRAAAPGDSTGVADAIRSRVASGDAGASATGSTAPGWGGSPRGWVPWVGLIVVAGIVGSVLGASGAFGRPAGETTVANVPVELGQTAAIYECIDGPILGRVPANTRVLAVSRSEDSLWLGVRDPQTLGGTVWVQLGDVSLDFPSYISDLTISEGCPTVVVTLPAPVVTEAPAPPAPPAPPKPNPPAPTSDTTPPTIGQQSVSPNPISSCDPAPSATVAANASDNVGVQSVSVSWSGAITGSTSMSFAGGTHWTYAFTPPNANGSVTFKMQARDAAGNLSPFVSTSVLNYNCIG